MPVRAGREWPDGGGTGSGVQRHAGVTTAPRSLTGKYGQVSDRRERWTIVPMDCRRPKSGQQGVALAGRRAARPGSYRTGRSSLPGGRDRSAAFLPLVRRPASGSAWLDGGLDHHVGRDLGIDADCQQWRDCGAFHWHMAAAASEAVGCEHPGCRPRARFNDTPERSLARDICEVMPLPRRIGSDPLAGEHPLLSAPPRPCHSN
jgi:hypothetical protein